MLSKETKLKKYDIYNSSCKSTDRIPIQTHLFDCTCNIRYLGNLFNRSCFFASSCTLSMEISTPGPDCITTLTDNDCYKIKSQYTQIFHYLIPWPPDFLLVLLEWSHELWHYPWKFINLISENSHINKHDKLHPDTKNDSFTCSP